MATKRLTLDQIDLSHIYEFVMTGDVDIERADPEIRRYLDLLDQARSMHNRIADFGHKDAIVAHFIKVEGITRHVAMNIYNDAMEYFYNSKNISKDAYRNIIAELKHKNYICAIQMAKNTQDVASADKILDSMAKVLGLDKDDPIPVPESAYMQPFKMYSNDAKYLGMPELNRTEIKKMLESVPEMSEKIINRLEEEAAMLPTVKLFLDEHEDPRKS